MSDWKISVAEIIGRPGEYRDLDITGSISGVETALASLQDTPVRARLRVESVVEGILVTGRLRGDAGMECARCLKRLSAPLDVEVCELFVRGGADAQEDAYRMSDHEIALEPMVRDAIALDLPLNPLCDIACRGMCAGCGVDLNSNRCACTEDEIDPRWAPLSVLRDQLQS